MGLLRWALLFLVIAIIAAIFGFGGIASGAAEIAKVLFFIFLAICVVFFILGLTAFRSLPLISAVAVPCCPKMVRPLLRLFCHCGFPS
jgi:uncharacterized membrane protein YtjA (UPF0391 family)